MITKSADKFPTDPIFCLFESLFSAFFNACLLSFEIIMIENELPPLCYTISAFKILLILFFLDCPIRASYRLYKKSSA